MVVLSPVNNKKQGPDLSQALSYFYPLPEIVQPFNGLKPGPFLVLGQFHLLLNLGPRNRGIVVVIHSHIVLVPLELFC